MSARPTPMQPPRVRRMRPLGADATRSQAARARAQTRRTRRTRRAAKGMA